MAKKKRQAPNLEYGVLTILSSGKILNLAEIRHEIPSLVELSAADLARHPKRPNEPKWYSDVSNRLLEDRAGSLIKRGLVAKVGRDQHRITEEGVVDLKIWNEMLKGLDGLSIEDLEDPE